MAYGNLTVSQGTSDFFQGSKDFDKNLALLKDKIREVYHHCSVRF